jgi:prolyl oligopeptidase PreP (S9A serine peptidase family)
LGRRRLEDPDSEETKEFVEKQADLAESVLAGCGDREGLRREVTRLFDHPRHGAPFRRGDKYFHFHNSGLQAQSVLYVQVCHQPATKPKRCLLLQLVSIFYSMFCLSVFLSLSCS